MSNPEDKIPGAIPLREMLLGVNTKPWALLIKAGTLAALATGLIYAGTSHGLNDDPVQSHTTIHHK